ncbi:MAG: tetratricopeptide repeat protein [Burkholderiales bacterium]|nr:tetratricopeptide repeat protein [Burkholderiales bacterium]
MKQEKWHLQEQPELEAGERLMREGRREEAEACFRKAIEADPQNAVACANLALILDQSGKFDEAGIFHHRAALLDADSAEIRFNLANYLAVRDFSLARDAYLETIRLAPDHFGAWLNLGNLLFDAGYVSAAKTAYTAAATHHPGEVSPLVNLGNVHLQMEEEEEAREKFEAALALSPDLAEAHQGLASVFHRQGEPALAVLHREKGYRPRPVFTLPAKGKGIPLLVLASSLEGNLPWRRLIDAAVFSATVVAVEYLDGVTLPEPRLIFNAIGDADLCREGLQIAASLCGRVPVINAPDAVLNTARMENAQRLSKLHGVITPGMKLFSRKESFAGPFPILVRAPGFHGGNHFRMVGNPEELESALQTMPGEEFIAMEWLDAGSPDGYFRKYRVMLVGGRLYPLHMAASRNWKVHYFSSEMAQNPALREEEAEFLRSFESVLGKRAISALEEIGSMLGLDYGGVDFSLDGEGNLLLYEANATMSIVPPPPDPLWDYRRDAFSSVHQAARMMMTEKLYS